MKEPAHNIGFVCKDHQPKPGKYSSHDPKTFLGKYVKLGFPARNSGVVEHMWVKVEEVTDKELIGTLDNDPIKDVGYLHGDALAFELHEIEDVMP